MSTEEIDGPMEGQPMTTQEARFQKGWDKIEQAINFAMEMTKKQTGAKEVVMREEMCRWVILADGREITEIVPRDMKTTN